MAKVILASIVLAAGLSRRAGPRNKLLLPAPDGSGRTVVRATLEAVCDAAIGEVIVVTGHERERIEAALTGLPVRIVFATDYAQGMGHSLAAGVRAAAADTQGLLMVPGDLPDLTADLVREVADLFLAEHGRCHIIPTAGGVRGHPVIAGAWIRPQLEQLTGDAGARHVLAGPAEQVRCRFPELNDRAIVRDVDVPPADPA